MQVVRRYLDFMKLVQNNKETLFGPNMALTKSVWEKVKSDTCIDDTKVHEDVDLAIHILKRGVLFDATTNSSSQYLLVELEASLSHNLLSILYDSSKHSDLTLKIKTFIFVEKILGYYT